MNCYGIRILAGGLVAILALGVSAYAAPKPPANNPPPGNQNNGPPPGNNQFNNQGPNNQFNNQRPNNPSNNPNQPNNQFNNQKQNNPLNNPNQSNNQRPNNPFNNPKPSNPLGDKPSNPIGNKPSNPLGDKPSNPLGDKPSNPLGNKPSNPLGNKPSNPIGDKPSNPIGNKPSNPLGDKPSNPLGNKPSNLIGNKPSNPLGDKPSNPLGNKPSNPLGNKPSNTLGNKPSNPLGDKPSNPLGNKPSNPLGIGAKPNGNGTKPNDIGTKVHAKPTGTKPPAPPQPSAATQAIFDKAPKDKKDKVNAAKAANEKATHTAVVKPARNGKTTTPSGPQKGAKPKGTPVDVKGKTDALGQVAKTYPAVGRTKNKPLGNSGVDALKAAQANVTDPKQAAAIHNELRKSPASGAALIDGQGIAALQKFAVKPTTSQEQAQVINKFLQGKTLNSQERDVFNGIGGQAPPGSPLAVAVAQGNLEIAANQMTTGFNPPFIGGLPPGIGATIINAGTLFGGFIPGGGQGEDFILGGGNSFPAGTSVVWIPSDSSAGFGPDGIPDGPGIECAVLPCEYPGFADIGGDQNADALELAASGLAQAADVLQQTRYLRVANDTDKPVTIFVQYQALNDQGDWVWSGDGDDALQFRLEPGEVTDLDDNGWRINAASAHIWVKSENGDEWNTFKNQELWLVPEQDENGNHMYQDQGIQIFDYAVR